MSRIANNPVVLPKGVEVEIDDQVITVKGAKGELRTQLNKLVSVETGDERLLFKATQETKTATAMTGTFRSLVSNMVQGVTSGFQKELELQGVGYRAQMQGKKLNLSLGFSHPVVYEAPEGIEIETPSQTQVLVKGIDKQLVGQVSADIRSYRPPEPYKGKGVRYVDEYVKRKEAKKK
ncbi:MAG: 50S ribosomal protein L6 [Gammaproteobacteria bacterium]|nr:50S ribosomal protein L6 [Gammaproteobacteria bacterium]|tara:strand:+ start:155 stop:688 length:534 start_codon:yes stop_codon:yes gene_type:complete